MFNHQKKLLNSGLESIGTMEKKLEATLGYWGYIGIMEMTMETTILYWGYIGKLDGRIVG